MKTVWLRLGPKYQRWVVVGAVLLGAWVVLECFSSPTTRSSAKAGGKQSNVRHFFTDRTSHETGLDNLAATVKSLTQQNEQLQGTLSLLQKSLTEENKKKVALEAEVEAKVKDLERQLSDVLARGNRQPMPRGQINDYDQSEQAAPQNSAENSYVKRAPLKIITHSAVAPRKKDEAGNSEGKNKKSSSLPAGAILSGILINGMDAPTTQAARREPVPSLVRLQLDAILPNLARSDVKECFLLLSGYGDISAERAYLRGETISCVCDDGSTIEEGVDGYAVGEDGKVGLRGRLISKQGRAIVNSMMAGFLGGAAKAFDTNPVPTINLGGGSKTMFQSSLSGDMFQGAAVKGAGQAMDRVSKFYLEMAENLFPVIEVDAGRELDFVVKKGSNF